MLKRRYSKKGEHYKYYKDVKICEEWYNFQNFAEWFENNYNPETMQSWQLDKDILVKILNDLGKKKWRWSGNSETFANDPEFVLYITHELEEGPIYLFGNFSKIFWRGFLDSKPDFSQFKQIKI
jgi:hypothetical protein